MKNIDGGSGKDVLFLTIDRWESINSIVLYNIFIDGSERILFFPTVNISMEINQINQIYCRQCSSTSTVQCVDVFDLLLDAQDQSDPLREFELRTSISH